MLAYHVNGVIVAVAALQGIRYVFFGMQFRHVVSVEICSVRHPSDKDNVINFIDVFYVFNY